MPRATQFPIHDAAQLAAYLRAVRRQRGVTQARLGAVLGVSAARISAIENDPGLVSLGQLLQILRVLGATLSLETHDRESVVPEGNAGGEW